MNTAKATEANTVIFCGVTRNGNPLFKDDDHCYCVVDEFLTDPDDMGEVSEIVRLINSGGLVLHVMSGAEGEQEPSHPVGNLVAAMPRGVEMEQEQPKAAKDTEALYTTEELADLVVRECSYVKFKEVSGKFKAEPYLYRVVKRGRTLDLVSAGFIQQTYRRAEPEVREKLLTLPVNRLLDLIYRCSGTR